MCKEKIDKITSHIIQCAYTVQRKLGYGFLETVYREALYIELSKFFSNISKEKELSVYYEGQKIGLFRADMVVENEVILELKTSIKTTSAHIVQLDNYLTATKISDGLLLNFTPNGLEVRRRFGPTARNRT